MEYPTEDKEFYELMDRKKREIFSLDVSEEERAKLYAEIQKTEKTYMESLARDFYGNLNQWCSALDVMGRDFKPF